MSTRTVGTWSLLAICLSFNPLSWAQSYTPPASRLHQYREKMEARLEVLRGQMTEEEFYHEGGEYAEFQKWFREWETRLVPHGDFDVYDRIMQNYIDAKFHDGGSYKSNNDPWQELGPKRRRNNMFGIGPIRKIEINKDDPDHMICTSSSGGLFYTTDGADEWHNAGTDLGWPHSGCQHAVYYPGELDTWFGLSTYGDGRASYVGGVFRTINEGGTWDWIADQADLNGPETRLTKLLFDEKLIAGDHKLFLGTNNGLFACENPSAFDPTWFPVLLFTPPSIESAFPGANTEEVHVEDMEYLPVNGTSTLCASMKFSGVANGGPFSAWRFMISTDNGWYWEEIANQPPIDPDHTTATVETSAGAQTLFYCLLGYHDGINPDSRVWTFDTSSPAWSLITTGTYGFDTFYGGGHGFGVDQSDASSLYVSNGTGLRRYFSGTTYGVSVGHVDVEDIVSHPAVPNVVWVAHHGGIDQITVNGTTTAWLDKSDGLAVAEVDAIASSESSPDHLVASWFHDGSGITRTPYADQWDPDWAYLQLPYDGTRCLVDRWNPDHVFQSGQGGVWKRHDQATTSTTPSSTNVVIPSQWWTEGDLNRKYPAHLYRSYLVNNGTTSWNDNGTPATHVNKEIEVLRSFDRGVTNEVMSNFRNNPEVCKSAGGDWKFDWEMFLWMKSSPANPDHLYAAMRDWDWKYRLFRTTIADHPDASAVANSWEEVPLPRYERDYPITGIAFDPEKENIIYISYNSSLFEDPADHDSPIGLKMIYKMDVSDLSAFPMLGSFDCSGPEPCDDLTMNLPNTISYQDVLAFEQGSDEGLYLATEVGVYFTNRKRAVAHDPMDPADPDDLSNTTGWVRVGDGLPHVISRGIEINYNVNRIRNGLNGRGTWEHGLHCPEAIDLAESGTYATDDFLEVENDISSNAIVPSSVSMKYRAGHEVHLLPGFHAEEGSHFHAFLHPCDQPGNSFDPKYLPVAPGMDDGPLEAGMISELVFIPNPTRGEVTVHCAALAEHVAAELRVYDASGRPTKTMPMVGPWVRLDLSGSTGLFMVVVTSTGKTYSGREIVQ
ncbi:MAG TPA: T9SS type A sorting domain-containing protein [Flavobacteriales bacterium]|nr:T9SS type A sorting domain-containing protein [Flavobacteriales bacterium]HMR27493.1 T9SS type A sorting domain-containing protein [Flavobacteriales bacterium]